MAGLLEGIGSVFTSLLANVGQVLGLFTTTPILQLMLGIMVFGATIGLGLRLVRR